VKEIISTTATK